MKQNVSEKNASLASKLLIMKLKQTAVGPPGLTEELKYFFYVQHGTTKKPFYFSTKWPMGKCIEFVLEKLSMAKSSSVRMRLFNASNEPIDSSMTLEDVIGKTSLVTPGMTLTLKEI